LKKLISYLVVLVILPGCSQEALTAESVMGIRNQFRGIGIGDELRKVLTELDCDEVSPQNPNRIEGVADFGHGATMQVSLELEQKALVAIQADIFLPDQAETLRLMDDLSVLLSSRYGEKTTRGDFSLWLDQAGKENPTEFALADESAEYGTPKLSITIYNFER